MTRRTITQEESRIRCASGKMVEKKKEEEEEEKKKEEEEEEEKEKRKAVQLTCGALVIVASQLWFPKKKVKCVSKLRRKENDKSTAVIGGYCGICSAKSQHV